MGWPAGVRIPTDRSTVRLKRQQDTTVTIESMTVIQERNTRTFTVWGMNQVPRWLQDYGAVPIALNAGAGEPYDWVVTVRAMPGDITRYGRSDGDVLGFTPGGPI